MNNEKFERDLSRHKKLMSSLMDVEKGKNLLIIPARELGENLALASANCLCEDCKTIDNLQFHHLISRYYQKFGEKYLIQRIYWANIMILCKKCHAKIEERKPDVDVGVISPDRINKVKKRYEIKAQLQTQATSNEVVA